MKAVDKAVDDRTQNLVPNRLGVTGPDSVVDVGKHPTPPVTEKLQYLPLLVPGKTPVIHTEVTQEDIDIIKHKRYIALLRDFDHWLINVYMGGLDTEVKRAWLRNACPEWFQRQNEAIDLIHDVKRKYDILRGANENQLSVEDCYFMFRYERELKYKFNEYTAMNLANSNQLGVFYQEQEPDALQVQTAFERGLFNTRRRFYEMYNVMKAAGGVSTEEFYESPGPIVDEEERKNKDKAQRAILYSKYNMDPPGDRPRAYPPNRVLNAFNFYRF